MKENYVPILRTLGIVGDSLSSGEFESLNMNDEKGWHDNFDWSWGQFLGRKNSITVYNFSHGGMTAKEFIEKFPSRQDWHIHCISYLIFLGANDLFQNLKIGSHDKLDEDSYVANMYKIIKEYKKIEPKARIFVLSSPLQGNQYKQRVDIMNKEIPKILNMFEFCYLVDIQKAFNFDENFLTKFGLGGHPNPMGYVHMANQFEKLLNDCIINNWEDFRQLGFVGTEFFNKDFKW